MADDTAYSFRPEFQHREIERAQQTIVQHTLKNRTGSSRDTQQQLVLAEEFIRSNIYNPVSISDIAEAAGVNIRALQRLFRKYRGTTPIQVLLNGRIAAAHEIILQRESNIREGARGQASLLQSGPFFQALSKNVFGCSI